MYAYQSKLQIYTKNKLIPINCIRGVHLHIKTTYLFSESPYLIHSHNDLNLQNIALYNCVYFTNNSQKLFGNLFGIKL